MSNWKSQITVCFGMTDKIFAGHANDEDRAFELLKTLRAEKVGWAELEKETRNFLQDCAPSHIDVQITKMKASMKPWLLD